MLSKAFAVSVEAKDVALVSSTVVATLSVFFFLRYVLYPKWRKVIPSPMRASFPKVSQETLGSQVYHPEVLPGARDVKTPVSILVKALSPNFGLTPSSVRHHQSL